MHQVLIVDRDGAFGEALADRLRGAGFDARARTSVDDGTDSSHLLMLSVEAFERAASEVAPGNPFIVYGRSPRVRTVIQALRAGAVDFLDEHRLESELIDVASAACNEHDTGPGAWQRISGHSHAIITLREQIERVARTPVTVLIQGPTGSGKELVARAIHERSERFSTGAFIALNCAAIRADQAEAELFGRPGADGQTQPGLMEAADRGTLFLDQVAELPLEAQARLLRLFEDPENRRTGSSHSRRVDVRLIAATQLDLADRVRQGRFREDLFHRLKGVEVHTAALRSTPEDIAEITDQLLPEIARRLRRPAPGLSTAARHALSAYSWPGNVRELRHALERAVVLCEDGMIEPADLAIDLPPAREAEPVPSEEVAAGSSGQRTTLEDYFVSFVLENQDQMTETELAQRLGISRKSLWERRQRLNIPRKSTRRRGPRTG